jgi:hypothetical protein
MFTQKKHKNSMGCPCSCLFVEEKPHRPPPQKRPTQRPVRCTVAGNQRIQRPAAAARKEPSRRTTQPRSTFAEDQSNIRYGIQHPNAAFHQGRTGGTTHPRPTASQDQRKIQSQIQPGSLTPVENPPSDNSFDSGYPESSSISITSSSSGPSRLLRLLRLNRVQILPPHHSS